MDTITYQWLLKGKLSADLLDEFERWQEVRECWRKNGSEMKLVPLRYIQDWDLEKRRMVAADLIKLVENGGIACGAFLGSRLIGFASVDKKIFGDHRKYAELKMLQVSRPYRSRGIGRKLLRFISEESRCWGIDSIYISAHSSKESQAFYRAVGCIPASEVNAEIAANEPFDCQMELEL